MDLNWSLDELYISFKSKEFLDDINILDDLINNISKIKDSLSNSDPKDIIEEYINKLLEFTLINSKLSNYVNLKISVNTKDNMALKYNDIIENKLTEIVGPSTIIEKYISSVENIDDIISESEILKTHEFYLQEIINNSKYLLSEQEENIIANMKNTGSSAWSKLKDNLVSSLMVEIDNKEYPLTVVLNMAYDKDRDIRKKAYDAEIKSYSKIDEAVASSLNAIKGEVITVSKLRGYKSPLDMTLHNSRMDKETLDAMFSALVDSLPIFRKYLRRKAEMLGYNNGLPFYELYAPIVENDMKFTYEEAGDYVEKNFRTFSEDLGNYARNAINKRWIDVMPKEGKVGGAFCENLNSIGESRILLNFGGNFGDVITMAHELGHGYHGECLKNETILNSDYPMPIAETASTFCETIVKNAAIKEANDIDALAILENDLSDNTQVIVHIYSRFLFEDNFFKKREESSLSVEEIKELMLDAQRKAYGDGLDNNYLHPYMWLWKPHY